MADQITLNNGHKIPALGFGTWLSKDPDECKNAVRAALDVGYRHIDTAFAYGNEIFIGEVLQEYFKAGKLKREDIFITTKVWMTYLEPDRVPLCMAQSLNHLQLDYVDLCLVHFPAALKHNDKGDLIPVDENDKVIAADVKLEDTWKAMEQLVKNGNTKSIGVSNFNMEQVERICKVAEIKPTTNQVECHIYCQQTALLKCLQERDITLTAFAPFGSPGRPSKKDGEANLLEDPVAKDLASKYNKSVAQVLLRQLIQRGIIVIPKSVHANRIKENFEVFDFKLTEDEMERLVAQDKNSRLFLMLKFGDLPEYPFKAEHV